MNENITDLGGGNFQKTPQKEVIVWKWRCPHCKDEKVSRSDQRHTMDVCKCGKCGIDLEEDYARGMGEAQVHTIEKHVGDKVETIKSEDNA